jgi:hypothetical protein
MDDFVGDPARRGIYGQTLVSGETANKDLLNPFYSAIEGILRYTNTFNITQSVFNLPWQSAGVSGLTNLAGTGLVDRAVGVYGSVRGGSTGTVTDMWTFMADLGWQTASPGGAIPNAVHFYAHTELNIGATITHLKNFEIGVAQLGVAGSVITDWSGIYFDMSSNGLGSITNNPVAFNFNGNEIVTTATAPTNTNDYIRIKHNGNWRYVRLLSITGNP